MVLIIGGCGSGKLEYAMQEYSLSASDFDSDPASGKPGLYNLAYLELDAAPKSIELLCRKRIVICDELGCGLVPIDPAVRERRERVGRLCVLLARRAERVVRVCCGIGAQIFP